MRRISTAERQRRLAVRHRLAAGHRTDEPLAIAESVTALHSSDPATVYLACLVRMASPAVTVVERALYDDRTLVRHHAMRRTMWVMPRRTARVAHATVTEKIARREQARNEAVVAASTDLDDPAEWFARGVDEIRALLAAEGPMPTRAVGQRLPHLAVPLHYGSGANVATLNAHGKMLQAAGFAGHLLRAAPTGSWTSSEYCWAETEAWLGEPIAGLERAPAAAELVDSYLRSFGPVTEADLRWWLGETATLVRAALSDAGAEPVELDDGSSAWVAAHDMDDTPTPDPWVRLLPGLDPTPMGWKDRAWYLPTDHDRLFDRFGNVGPTIWADGQVVGGWVQRPDATVVLELLEPLTSDQHDLLTEAVAGVEAAVDGVVVKPRFPSRNQKPLLAGVPRGE